jgi:hypothetical protein
MTTDVRAWLKANADQWPGEDIPARGKLSDEWMQRYRDGTAADAPPPDDGSEYDESSAVSAADFPPDEPVRPRAERAPRPVAQVKGKSRGGLSGLLSGARGNAKPGGKAGGGRKRPRVSLDRLVERMWGQVAWAAGNVPPMQKMLYAQAPFAGMVLEDVIRDTPADRLLQPVARNYQKFVALDGLLGPPLSVMMIMANAPAPGEEPNMACKMGFIGLRMSLMSMAETVGDRLDEVMERAADNRARASQIDEFIEFLFSMSPQDGQGQDAASMEDEAIRRASAMYANGQAQ